MNVGERINWSINDKLKSSSYRHCSSVVLWTEQRRESSFLSLDLIAQMLFFSQRMPTNFFFSFRSKTKVLLMIVGTRFYQWWMADQESRMIDILRSESISSTNHLRLVCMYTDAIYSIDFTNTNPSTILWTSRVWLQQSKITTKTTRLLFDYPRLVSFCLTKKIAPCWKV